MKITTTLVLAAAALLGPACSLVTVPVKVAGGIVETTVTTTGDVVSAPFKAIGGNDRDNRDSKEQQKSSEAPSTEAKKPKE